MFRIVVKKHFLFIFFSLFLPENKFYAQQVNIDSLKEAVEAMGRDSETVIKLHKLSGKYRLLNLDAALLCGQAAFEKSKNISSKKIQIDAEYALALVYSDKSDFVNTILHLTSAQKKAEETGDIFRLSICYNSLGNSYAILKQYKFAITYYKKALDFCTRLKQNRKTAIILGNMGNVLYQKSESDKKYLDSALIYYLQAYNQDVLDKDTGAMVSMLNNMSLVYGDKHQFKEARDRLVLSKKITDVTGDMDSKINYYSSMARLVSYEGNNVEANKYLDTSMLLSQQIGSIDRIADVYIARSDIGLEQKDYKTAYEYYIKYKDIKDSILNAENFAQASDFQNKYEREKKQQQIEKLQFRNQNQRIIITSIIVFFLALVIFAFIIYRRLQENRRQKNIIEQQRNEMLDSIHYAKRIQTALLASENLLKDNLPEHFIFYKPKDIVSGDFYWATKADEKFIFCLGDCTGHGVPGAFMSLLNISKLNETINEKKINRPDLILNCIRTEIINALNQNGAEETKDGMDCTLCSFDFKNYTMEYAAANNAALIIRKNELINLPADKIPVGKAPKDTQLFTLQTVKLQKGDMVYLFTDGYADQFGGPKGKKFRYKNLQTIILANNHLTLVNQHNVLDRLFTEWMGNLEQIDDVAIVGIRIA